MNLSSFLVIALASIVCSAFNRYDEALKEVTYQLTRNESTFWNFHQFKAVDIGATSFVFNSFEITNTSVDFRRAYPVLGVAGRDSIFREVFKSDAFEIFKPEIMIPKLVITGFINVILDSEKEVTVAFNATQTSASGQEGASFKFSDIDFFHVFISATQDNVYAIPGLVTYSNKNITLDVQFDCEPLEKISNPGICATVTNITKELGLANLDTSLKYRMTSAIRRLRLRRKNVIFHPVKK